MNAGLMRHFLELYRPFTENVDGRLVFHVKKGNPAAAFASISPAR
jgi:hypothetical protein